jgi:hypothetical protein
MRQPSRPFSKLSVCSIYEATGTPKRKPEKA